MPPAASSSPDRDQDAGAELGHQQLARGGRRHDQAADQRQERQAGHHRRVAQDLLQVVGEEQEDPEQADRGQPDRQVRAAPEPVEDDPQRQQRMGHPPLHQREQGEQDHPAHQQADRERVAPPLGVGLGQPVDEGDQAGHHQHRPRPVEVHAGVAAITAQQPDRGRDRDHREDHVDVQAPAPGQVLGQHAAEQQPDRAAGPGDRAEDAERLAPLGRVGERHRQRGQGGRRQQRAERALDRAGDEQHREVL